MRYPFFQSGVNHSEAKVNFCSNLSFFYWLLLIIVVISDALTAWAPLCILSVCYVLKRRSFIKPKINGINDCQSKRCWNVPCERVWVVYAVLKPKIQFRKFGSALKSARNGTEYRLYVVTLYNSNDIAESTFLNVIKLLISYLNFKRSTSPPQLSWTYSVRYVHRDSAL